MNANLVPIPLPERTTGVGAWVEIIGPAADLAKQIAGTEFVPRAMRDNPAVVTACILFGAEIGIGPMQSLAKIVIVEGKPAPAAELARALLLAEGHDMWIEEATNTRVVLGAKRSNSDHIQKVTWTMDDAKKAGLAGKMNWQKYPRQMLLARASAELARMVAPDALGGISLFAEELDDADIVPVDTPDTPAPAPKATRTRRLSPVVAVEPEVAEIAEEGVKRFMAGVQPTPDERASEPEPLPLLPDEEDDAPFEPPMITDAQIRKLMATYNGLDVKDRAHQKRISSQLLGMDLASHKDLTVARASTLIEMLTALMASDLEWGEDGPTVTS